MRFLLFIGISSLSGYASVAKGAAEAPRIVNIVNFIRQIEPRDSNITEEVLYQTVCEQVKLMNRYDFTGTFLLQYDALINPKYQTLFKSGEASHFEVGGWWEITQPHVEAAGMKWRGRYLWDWHADVGFSTGYTPGERELLVDEYMARFKEVFGKYPASVGSWFIDAHTLGYMYEKYGLEVSCNCKDQWGTDGYTLWGGYWNQAYYPSRKNAYMPAQSVDAQIPVPIFRMLGSDPIYQYGLGSSPTSWQGVISLEPVYPDSGGDPRWVKWFLKSMFEDPCMGFNYAQAGQENSFTWNGMEKGLEMQMPLIDDLRKKGVLRVETLVQSGRWFKEKYKVTPPTALSALTDVRDQGNRTVWYNSRFYRANLMWTRSGFFFRDIHMFDENLESDYLRERVKSNQCFFTTLPVVDGMLWSCDGRQAGLKLVKINGDGSSENIVLSDIDITDKDENILFVKSKMADGTVFTFTFHEDRMTVNSSSRNKKLKWALELVSFADKAPAFDEIAPGYIAATEKGIGYKIICREGRFVKTDGKADVALRMEPDRNALSVDFKGK